MPIPRADINSAPILSNGLLRYPGSARMEALLNFAEPLEVALLDRTVSIMYQGAGPEQQRAQRILAQLQEHPDAWQRVDRILEQSTSPATRYFALQILERLVQTRWNALPRPQCEGIKNYIVGLIIRTSSDETAMQAERVYLNKLNLLLVQILKHEWPKHWPNFISELVGAGRTSLSLCENNMVILRLLSEEVFDYSAEQMTTVRAKTLKQQLCGEFAEVFQLCSEVLEHATRASLLTATLEALLRFLKWIPLGYIFETTLIDTLGRKYLTLPAFRNVTLGCLTEVAALQVGTEYDAKFTQLFTVVIETLNSTLLPYRPDADFNQLWESAGDADQRFLQNLAIFLSTLLSGHLRCLEASASWDQMALAHLYLLKISLIDDREVFKVCLEYWNRLVNGLYNESPYHTDAALLMLSSPQNARSMSRRQRYKDICSQLRVVMIERMVKPEEVLIVEDENGNIVREHVKETDTAAVYKAMRTVLIFLTHLDVDDTERVMTGKLSRQIDGTEWSWANLSRLCWAIGSISGAMNEETEKNFLVSVVRDLLGLVEMKRGKDNKAVVAANIMYVVGQYPRFLRAHWRFLKTVVNKLFEFMHELHEGVQDMACDTFIKIVRKCRRHFVFRQPGEQEAFVDELLRRLPVIICDLQPGQVHTFYRAVGYMLESSDNTTSAARLNGLMSLPNESWDQIIAAATSNPAVLQDIDTLRSLANILKTNIAVCSSAGISFKPQLTHIFMDMLSVYRTVSGFISEAVRGQGPIAVRTPLVRAMRTVKKDILRVVQEYVVGSLGKASSHPGRGGSEAEIGFFADTMVPPLFEAVLVDYRGNVEDARDAEVLLLTAAVMERMGSRLTGQVAPVLETVFEPTLSMISKDFSDYPEHRAAFFRLLKAINSECFEALLRLPPTLFRLTIDSVSWAFKHTHREIAETGLQICLELLGNFAERAVPADRNAFYRAFLLSLLQDILAVCTDANHKAGFPYHAAILAQIFRIVSTPGQLTVPIDPQQSDNAAMVRQFTINLLSTAYTHLQRTQIETFIKGCFDLNCNLETFKAHLKDFLIALREFASPDDLFQEEVELEAERKAQAETEAAAKVPGLVKPDDNEDDEWDNEELGDEDN